MRLSVGYVHSLTYMSQIGGCLQGVCTLSVTWGSMAVGCCGALCHLHEADWRVFAGDRGVLCRLLEADWLLSVGVYSVIYIWQDGGCLLGEYSVSYTRQVGGRLQRAGVYTVSYIRQVFGCPWGVCEQCQLLQEGGGCLQDVRNLLVIWGRLAIVCSGCVICQVLATHGWLSAGVCTLSVTLGRLEDVYGVSVNYVSYFRKFVGCLQGVCNLLFISDRLVVACSGCVI